MEQKKKRTKFLNQMEGLVPWKRLIELIKPHYPKGLRGRPPKAHLAVDAALGFVHGPICF
jgi:hypothetical protein